MREITVEGLAHFGGRAVLREMTIGAMRRLRKDHTDAEELGLAMLAQSMASPAVTVDDLDALPASAAPDLQRLLAALNDLHEPEDTTGSPPA